MTEQAPTTIIWNARRALDFGASKAAAALTYGGSRGLRDVAKTLEPLAKAFDAYVVALLRVAGSDVEWTDDAGYGAERVADLLRTEAAKLDADEAANPSVWSAKREEFI